MFMYYSQNNSSMLLKYHNKMHEKYFNMLKKYLHYIEILKFFRLNAFISNLLDKCEYLNLLSYEYICFITIFIHICSLLMLLLDRFCFCMYAEFRMHDVGVCIGT